MQLGPGYRLMLLSFLRDSYAASCVVIASVIWHNSWWWMDAFALLQDNNQHSLLKLINSIHLNLDSSDILKNKASSFEKVDFMTLLPSFLYFYCVHDFSSIPDFFLLGPPTNFILAASCLLESPEEPLNSIWN